MTVRLAFGLLLLFASPLHLGGVVRKSTFDAVRSELTLSQGWQLHDASEVTATGDAVSQSSYKTAGWYKATVPGTVLTSLVNEGIYADPMYGENARPESIPESLARSSFWYRTTFVVPSSYKGRHIWLNFFGINYAAEIWVNGHQIGVMRGAFRRGVFDLSTIVRPGASATLAVLISPQPHPGVPHEHTLRAGVGKNGGESAVDGPTFFPTIGWDWLAAVRDRNMGIWQKVTLSASGPVLVRDPLITSDLPLPRTDVADLNIQATLKNVSDSAVSGVLQADFAGRTIQQKVEIAAHSESKVSFEPSAYPLLHMDHPKLWWPNGFGDPDLYKLRLRFSTGGAVSDESNTTFGIRKITYSVPGSEDLTISVNGVPVFIRGGDWGMDEAMKRIPRERLEAQMRMHKIANLNMIRNWVGQSTSEDFYELADKYGILLWDEFFQANPSDGPNPDDLEVYIANVRDKILRFRNHPSIAVWCARNEGFPPPEIDAELRKLMAELEPTRLYQPSSTDGHGVHSGGPYYWRTPEEFFKVDAAFKTETGSMSIPTLESIHGMLPQKDWEVINDDWAQHDYAKGAAHGDSYLNEMAKRYGPVLNLADFVRKGQMMNFEAYRAMYEGRNAEMFRKTTGVITWMSHPAQPSFVWQLYHYDLDPNAALFAVKAAGEHVHIQLNAVDGTLQIVNNSPDTLSSLKVEVSLYDPNGGLLAQKNLRASAAASSVETLAKPQFEKALPEVYFINLRLIDQDTKLISENFYWSSESGKQANFELLSKMPAVTLQAKVTRQLTAGNTIIQVELKNATSHIALLTHVQLRDSDGNRVLPTFYSDNYLTLLAGDSKTLTLTADSRRLQGKRAVVVLDGWNVSVERSSAPGASIERNLDADVNHWPKTYLPTQTLGLR